MILLKYNYGQIFHIYIKSSIDVSFWSFGSIQTCPVASENSTGDRVATPPLVSGKMTTQQTDQSGNKFTPNARQDVTDVRRRPQKSPEDYSVSNMASDVQFTQPSDEPKLADVFFAAFSDRFNRTMFPDKPDVRVWITKNMLCGEGISEDQIMLKVTDPSNSDVVAAFAKWVRPSSGSSADHDPQAEDPAVWPESSDGELCDRFFGTMDRHHKDAMKGRPHYCMFLL